MRDLNLTQGSPEWLAARAKCLTASQASSMMGFGQYMTRTELIHYKATGIEPEYDEFTLRLFELGHKTEEMARPNAEKIIGEPLFPIVATDDSGKYLASMDGATILCDIGFEHKLWNEELASEVSAGNVPDSHRWQLVQQCMIFGFKKILFMVSNGTEEKSAHCWFSPESGDFKRLIDGWEQFEKDLAAYVPQQAEVKPVGQAPDALPALFVEVSGKVIASNLDAFKARAIEVFSSIKTKLETDEDFADAEKTAKWCKEVEDKLEAAKANALGQTASIDDLFRTIDAIKDEARQKRLTLDKLVKAEKENRKAELVRGTESAFAQHVAELRARVGLNFDCRPASFSQAIHGLKSLDSMRDKLSVALANAKVEANEIADRIERNRKAMGEHTHLFPDFAQVCTKADDDFSTLVVARVSAEQQRKQQEAERAAQAYSAKAITEENKTQSEHPADIPNGDGIKRDDQSPCVQQTEKSETQAVLSITGDTQPAPGPTMKLGEISAILGFAVTADFIASLGVHPVGQERAAKLYPASKFPTICRLISDHVLAQAFKKAA